jgi:FkbM family methyltransferase
MLRMLRRAFALHVVRPYIYHELPGWGRLYDKFVGGYRRNHHWQGLPKRWARGKLHGYEMLLDLNRWSPRQTFFLGRYYDLQTQLATSMLLGEGDTFVDIGANEGMIALLASRVVGEKGKVIAFEPNPGPRAALEAAVDRNGIGNIDVRAMGLGSVDAELTLHVPRINSGEGSFGRPDYDASEIDELACPVRVGDTQLSGESPRLIKIDVEGFEAEVLHGLENTLQASRPMLITEVVSRHLANAGSSANALTCLLDAHGYSGWRMSLRKLRAGHVLVLQPENPGGEDYWSDVLWIHRDDQRAHERVRIQGAVTVAAGRRPGPASAPRGSD